MSFNTREFAEPVAWRIELPDSQYFVDDIDDAQAVDDLTNSSAVAIPLYQYPDNSTHEELRLIHEILLCVGECPPVYDFDTLTVRYVKDLCHAFNAQNQGPSPTPIVPDTPTPRDPRTDHGAALLMIAGLQRELTAAKELAYKFKWQVRNTCTRAEKAEADLAATESARDLIHQQYNDADAERMTLRKRLEGAARELPEIKALVKAAREAQEAMAWDLGGEPLPTLMIKAKAELDNALAALPPEWREESARGATSPPKTQEKG